jgi:hypothetical protein
LKGYLQMELRENIPVNYDETMVPHYTLPDVLRCEDGTPVNDAKAWREQRRPEIMALFEQHVYGRTPTLPIEVESEVTSVEPNALGGQATRKGYQSAFAAHKQKQNSTSCSTYPPRRAHQSLFFLASISLATTRFT